MYLRIWFSLFSLELDCGSNKPRRANKGACVGLVNHFSITLPAYHLKLTLAKTSNSLIFFA